MRPVQTLRVGDLIATLSRRPQPIRWIGHRHFDRAALRENARLRPVRILAGALGGGLPHRDLLVSRQHRMLVQSRIAERMFGTTEVLIPAVKLTALPGIYVDYTVSTVRYFHLLFDHHQVIFAENAPTESLYAGAEAMESLGPESRREIYGLFPELADQQVPETARFIPHMRQQTQLIRRHLKNNKALLQPGALGAGRDFAGAAKIPRHPS
ncbi:MAG: Hint domain-containing protein [Paracoccaceae bacterium]